MVKIIKKNAKAGKKTGAGLPFDRVIVLAIGVETYQNPPGRGKVNAVAYAEADATALAALLQQIYGPDIEVDATVLTSSMATLATVRETARYLINGLSPDDLFVLFYAGHGFHSGGQNRLTCYDTNPDNLAGTTVGLTDEIMLPLQASPCRRALMFIDACAEDIVERLAGRSIVQGLSPEEIERVLDEADYSGVFLSCSPGERSFGASALGHGVFTHHLLSALRGEASEALEGDRWLTDVSLRDWIAGAVKRFVTKNLQVSGHQTPRAILNAPHSFRIRHVQSPPKPAGVTLADLKLRNRDAHLEGVEGGHIRSLPGFTTAKGHTVPKVHADSVDAWVGRLMKEQLAAELDDLRASCRKLFGYSRAETALENGDAGGSLDTPTFRYAVLCEQDPEDPAKYRVQRQLELRDGWEAQREAIQALFEMSGLDRLVVDIDPMPTAFESIADILDQQAVRAGAHFEERSASKRLSYSTEEASISIDLLAGRVEITVAGAEMVDLVDGARAFGLGWRAASPMLAAP